MAQIMVNFRMDEGLKKEMEDTCRDLGLSMTTAFTIFARKMTREKRIPFDVAVDPLFTDNNLNYLKKVLGDIEAGRTLIVNSPGSECERGVADVATGGGQEPLATEKVVRENTGKRKR